jgi:hypothetical protein
LPGGARLACGRRLDATSEDGLPCGLVQRLSELFPRLTFRVNGTTTKQTYYECWDYSQGLAKRIHAWDDYYWREIK